MDTVKSNGRLDVVGIGNAIVDVISPADEAFLERHGMVKGTMALIDEARANAIYEAMGATVITSGGSAGNTMAGIASLGGRAGYVGRVRDDDLGHAFRHDITAIGVRFSTPAVTQGPSTARCLILVTADSQRTMNTYLGTSVNLGPRELDAEMIRSASITYLEGYLYDEPLAKQAFHEAAEIAHGAGGKVALSLSDPFCVGRHRDDFLHLVDRHVDVLFGNEAEIAALFEGEELEASMRRLRGMTELAAVTRGPAGSVVVSGDATVRVAAERVARVVDTTGAGDLYAAGFLYGLTHGAPLDECGRYGSVAAAEAIGHFGARPQTSLAALIA